MLAIFRVSVLKLTKDVRMPYITQAIKTSIRAKHTAKFTGRVAVTYGSMLKNIEIC